MHRKKILSAVDPYFIHHSLYSKELPVRNFTGAKYQGLSLLSINGKPHYQVTFKTNSATTPGAEEHTQGVVLLKLRELLKSKEPKLMRSMVLEAISEGDLLVGCSCKAFKFWGYKWICTKRGIIHPSFKAKTGKERKAPDIRNPLRRGIICKHLDLVLSVLVFNNALIVRDLKKRELEDG